MAIHKFEKLLEGRKISIGANIFFRWPMSGTLKSVRLIGTSGGFTGSWQFDLRSNGVYLFSAGRLILTPSDVDDVKTGLSIAVVEGETAALELVIPSSGIMFSPLTIICEVEDGLTPGVAGEYTLPSEDGSAGQVMKTDGSGVVSWANESGGGGGGSWGSITGTLSSQTDLQTALNGKQDSDSDLSAIAGISPSNDDIIQRKSGEWTNRTMAQVKTDLVLVKGDVGLGNVDNTSDSTKNSATATLTNKRVNPRVSATTSSSTPTPDADTDDEYNVTALAATATFGAPTGTPVNGQPLIIRIKDNGTARGLSFNSIYRAIGVTLPTTTVISKTMYLGMIYNSADTKWDVLAVNQEA